MKGPGIQQFKGNNLTNMKGSNFLSLQNFRYILRFDFFFLAMFRTTRGQRRKKKLKLNSLITRLFSKGPSETD